jgi:hypothetical protein
MMTRVTVGLGVLAGLVGFGLLLHVAAGFAVAQVGQPVPCDHERASTSTGPCENTFQYCETQPASSCNYGFDSTDGWPSSCVPNDDTNCVYNPTAERCTWSFLCDLDAFGNCRQVPNSEFNITSRKRRITVACQ